MRIARFIRAEFIMALTISLLGLISILKTAQADESQSSLQAMPQPADAGSNPHHVRISKLAGYIQKKYKLAEQKAATIVAEAFRNAEKYEKVEPELILAVIAVESTFKERVVSNQGARGLMQVLPQAHPQKVKAVGGVHKLFDLEKNIYAGTKILADYLDESNGNLKRALMIYNGGYIDGNWRYADRVLRIYQDMQRQATPPNGVFITSN